MDGKVKVKVALDQDYKTLVELNSYLRMNFYEFQMIRAAYFGEMAQIMYRVYLFQQIYINNEAFHSLPLNPVQKNAVSAFYEQHSFLVSRGFLLRRFKTMGRLMRENLLQILLRTGQACERCAVFGFDCARSRPSDSQHICA